jgi:hypothetical protein
MGGIKAVNIAYPIARRATSIFLTPSGGVNTSQLYVADNTRVYRCTINNNNLTTTVASGAITPAIVGNGESLLWQANVVIQNNARQIVFLQTNNAVDISQTAAPTMYAGPVEAAAGTQLTATVVPAEATGGMCYSAPYLFLYGTAGYVGYSRNNNPLNFVGGTSGTFRVSNDKVIYAANIRGGSAAPSLLFWTLSSVVRVSNVGDQVAIFKKEVISNDTSILSSRCVVEYGGMFFWLGTDCFYNYNGIIDTTENDTNLNYFYSNLDMNKRQLVFGFVKKEFSEIWWAYPEIANQGDPTIGCTRAIVYNKKKNFWYDTPFQMDCAFNFKELGITFAYGPLQVGADAFKYIWALERGINQAVVPGAGGEEVSTPIPSSFTTPIFSFASPFNPARPPGTRGQPIDRWIELIRIEPDFVMDRDADQMQVRINTKNYAQSPTITSAAYTFTRTTEKEDMREQGRQMSLTFSSTANFEMGNVQLHVSIGDGK